MFVRGVFEGHVCFVAECVVYGIVVVLVVVDDVVVVVVDVVDVVDEVGVWMLRNLDMFIGGVCV